MKKLTLLVLLFSLAHSAAIAQPLKKLQKKISLTIPVGDDDKQKGTRGASVAWNPMTKKYYASMAGNSAFPLAVFDAAGKKVSAQDQACLIDTRGLWYNPTKKTICGNGYDTNGWFSYKLDAKGQIKDINNDYEGLNQPNNNATGAYSPATKTVYFVSGNLVSKYNAEAQLEDVLTLHIGRTEVQGPAEEEAAVEGYNTTTIIYTGIKNQELGLLNAAQKQIELYSLKNGYLTKVLPLPDTAPAEFSFNFAYCNGYYWLFNIEKRTWEGYR